MKAREIFISAQSVMVRNLKLVVTSAVVFLLSQIAVACTSIIAPVRYDSMYAIGSFMLAPYKDYFHPMTFFYGGVGLSVLASLITLVFHFYTQAVLRDRPASLRHEALHAGHALVRAPWALVLVVLGATVSAIGIVLSVLSRWMIISYIVAIVLSIWFLFIPLYYFAQLLYDNYSSLSSTYKTSWEYVRKSWFIFLKFVVLYACIYLVPVIIAKLAIRYASVPLYIALGVDGLALWYINILQSIGINIIYKKIAQK